MIAWAPSQYSEDRGIYMTRDGVIIFRARIDTIRQGVHMARFLKLKDKWGVDSRNHVTKTFTDMDEAKTWLIQQMVEEKLK